MDQLGPSRRGKVITVIVVVRKKQRKLIDTTA
jgi:hypothetical protein